MKLLEEKITRTELLAMAQDGFGNLVKAVVDVGRNLLVLDAELQADQEAFLLGRGSRQQDLWGINLYPEFALDDENFVEFDSMINLRGCYALFALFRPAAGAGAYIRLSYDALRASRLRLLWPRPPRSPSITRKSA